MDMQHQSERAKRVEAEQPTRKLQLRQHASQNDSSGSAASRGAAFHRPIRTCSADAAQMQQHAFRAKARRPSLCRGVVLSGALHEISQRPKRQHTSLVALRPAKSSNPGGQGNHAAAAALPIHGRGASRLHCTALHSLLSCKLLLGIGAAALSSSSDSLPRHPAKGSGACCFRDIRPAFLQASCRAKSHAGPTRTSCCSCSPRHPHIPTPQQHPTTLRSGSPHASHASHAFASLFRTFTIIAAIYALFATPPTRHARIQPGHPLPLTLHPHHLAIATSSPSTTGRPNVRLYHHIAPSPPHLSDPERTPPAHHERSSPLQCR